MRRLIIDKLSKLHPLEVLFRVIVLSIGVVFFSFAAWQAIESIRIIQSYDKYKAEVKRCDTDGAPNSRFSFYQCDVKYRSAEGSHSATIDKLLSKYSVGEQVDIYIGRGEQYSVHSGGFFGLWAIPTLLATIGCVFAAFGLWPNRETRVKGQ